MFLFILLPWRGDPDVSLEQSSSEVFLVTIFDFDLSQPS